MVWPAVVACGEEGNLDPLETEFALRLPPAPLLEPVADDGNPDSCGELTAQIRIVPSAEPEASNMRSGPPWRALCSPNIEADVPGSTQTVHTASVCPSRVAFGSTRPRSQTRTVASWPPEKIQPSPVTRPPVRNCCDAGGAAKHITDPI